MFSMGEENARPHTRVYTVNYRSKLKKGRNNYNAK